MTSRQAASASPVNFLEMLVLCSHARPTNSETLREGRRSLFFLARPVGRSDVYLSLGITALRPWI